jgi:hypothetical protein
VNRVVIFPSTLQYLRLKSNTRQRRSGEIASDPTFFPGA